MPLKRDGPCLGLLWLRASGSSPVLFCHPFITTVSPLLLLPRGSACINPLHCQCPEENVQAVPSPKTRAKKVLEEMSQPLFNILWVGGFFLNYFVVFFHWKQVLSAGASPCDFPFQAHILCWLVQAAPCAVSFCSFEAPNSPHIDCKHPTWHSASQAFESSILLHI